MLYQSILKYFELKKYEMVDTLNLIIMIDNDKKLLSIKKTSLILKKMIRKPRFFRK